jgi:hypothetical protein
MENKKKINISRFVILCLFTTFSFVFALSNLGYTEYQSHNKKIITEENIKKFENDIKSGKELDIESYVVKETFMIKNQNSLKLSKIIGSITRKTIQKIFKILNKIVET